jgi:TonB-dependent starch-binding outer membrane protein SusC
MGRAAPFSIGGFTFLGQWVEEGYPVGMLRGTQPIVEGDSITGFNRNAFLGSPLPDAFGNLNVSITFRDRLRLYAVADYQWGAQGVATDDVLRFAGGVLSEGRYPTDDFGQLLGMAPGAFFDLAGLWVEDTDYMKVRLISLSYEVPQRFHPIAGLRTLEAGFRVVNPFNFAKSTFDPEITGSNAPTQGGVNVGAYGYGTESPPRQFLFNLRVGF